MIHPSHLPMEIVRDFQIFLDYIDQENVTLTKRNKHLQRKHCWELNQRFEVQTEEVPEKSDQIYYPRVHLFYHLALQGKLMTINGNRAVLQERVTDYQDFTDLEKYTFLLETLWVDTDWVVFTNDERHVYTSVIRACGRVISEPPEQKIATSGEFADFGHMVMILSYFGIWEYTRRKEMKPYKQMIPVESIQTTFIGWKLLRTLVLERPISVWSIPGRKRYGEWVVNPGQFPNRETSLMQAEGFVELMHGLNFCQGDDGEWFMDVFKELFVGDELNESFSRACNEIFEGTYTLRMTAGDRTEIIECSSEHTMEDLHETMLEVYELVDDHLYSFFLSGEAWKGHSISSPGEWMSGSPADEITIAETGVKEGDTILYIHDFGEEFRVKIEVMERIAEKMREDSTT